ncbi:MAG TPA: PEP-CTERM sorting domain-containing protein [Phycisphaerae bacterium]|nr:PEP-CTERM sorting domain-containing protein [Phycisphaerae bacterium]
MKTVCKSLGIAASLAALAGVGSASKDARADIMGLNPTDLTQAASDVGNDGLFFTPTISVNVTQLGYYGPSASGNPVGLYNVSTDTLLGSATITTSDAQSGSFYYAPITPVTLTAGTEYAVVGFYSGASGNQDSTASSVSGGSGITYDGYQYDYSNTLDLPQNSYETAYFGPNFKYSISSPIPEPATASLMGLAGLGLLLRRSRVSKTR